MGLSDDERRILGEIEAGLAESDPVLVETITRSSVYRHALRNALWGAALLVGGLVLLLVALSTSVLIAFAGFLVMLLAAFVIEKNLRHVGRAGWRDLLGSKPAADARRARSAWRMKRERGDQG